MSIIPGLLPRQCVDCSNVETPVCNCSPGEICQKINKDCNTCATIKCVKNDSLATTSSGGVSKGALAGAIVGVIAFLAIAVGIFIWYRRQSRNKNKESAVVDKPAPAADVLSRPDPTEKATSPAATQASQDHYFAASHAQRDPESNPPSSPPHRPQSVRSNPFTDAHSIQTAGTESTNVIPIALVAPDPTNGHSRSPTPVRPIRSPELQLNLDHVNVSHDNLKAGAGSQRSGVTGITRNSYMTSASYSSDLLNEAPMIVTPTVRHVVGSVKAEMVDARSPHSPISDGLKTPASATRPAIASPLAHSSFGPADARGSPSSEEEDPFSDPHISMATTRGTTSPPSSVTTFGQSSTHHPSANSEALPWSQQTPDSRPASMSTQAGSVIDISSATRVNISTVSGQSVYRTMVGRLVSPSTAGFTAMSEQQRHAAQAYSRARESEAFDASRRTSGVSAISATADSILEAFPFVPPSPISNRPIRTPPVSPLAQQSFSVTPATPTFQQTASQSQDVSDADLVAPDRRMLGFSTGSQLSTASTGLGSFPFQIETSPEPNTTVRQRASLDTLAITSDITSHPLGLDKDKSQGRKD